MYKSAEPQTALVILNHKICGGFCCSLIITHLFFLNIGLFDEDNAYGDYDDDDNDFLSLVRARCLKAGFCLLGKVRVKVTHFPKFQSSLIHTK